MQTQPSEMIERVAAAIYGVAPIGERPWEDAPATTRFDCVLRARVAIAAMREPTEAMREAARNGLADTEDWAGDLWRAMIDEALGA
jgi:hypothetical protein